MPDAEIIAIGTELLLGEIVDTNTSVLAKYLRDEGINIYRTMSVGDNVARIATAIRESLQRADIVITSGGLGPTVDDMTRDGVAQAFGVSTIFSEELWQLIQERFQKYGRPATDNNRRQAFLPANAQAIPNPVGTAPAFYVHQDGKLVVSLPGVPKELIYLYENAVRDLLARLYPSNGKVFLRTLHVSGMGESALDDLIGEFETLSNPTVGLAAHSGQIDIRLGAKASNQDEANVLLDDLEEKIKAAIGDAFVGIDSATLPVVVQKRLTELGVILRLEQTGFTGQHSAPPQAIILSSLPEVCDNCFRVRLIKNQGHCLLDINGMLLSRQLSTQRSYGGPMDMAEEWAMNILLDLIRRNLPEIGRENG